jgi:uncharacterized protein YndB with AHSA1/START domain
MATMKDSDGLVVTLPTDTQILITLDIGVPRHLVYKTWTEAELVERWWGGDQGEVTSVESDLRVGGAWRYVIFANGSYWGFHGEYLEVVPDECVFSTEIFENQPEMATLRKVTFTEKNERTILTILVQHSCQEFRDIQVNPHWRAGLQGLKSHVERVALSLL